MSHARKSLATRREEEQEGAALRDRHEPHVRVWSSSLRAAFLLSSILLLTGLASLSEGTALRAVHADTRGEQGWPEIVLEPVVMGGLDDPVLVTHAGDGSGRLFIVEKPGRIRIYKDGALLKDPFLDITGNVLASCEYGLLGLAFSPDYSDDGDFYVYYSNLQGHSIVARFHVSEDNPDLADPDSEEEVFSLPQPYCNHNGGMIEFGPDGYLYIGLGDGGGGGDPDERAQRLSELFGKMLRIDVETGDPERYTIPEDNPFVDVPGARPEIWAYGLRNPWRFSFDRESGDLYIGDVGQDRWEEINFQPASSAGGENYGWDVMEGTHCHEPPDNCTPPPDHVPPIIEYRNSDVDHAVVGGYVYRGSQYPRMYGLYFFTDLDSAVIWAARRVGDRWEYTDLYDHDQNLVSFGEDEEGNLYVMAIFNNEFVYRLTDPSGPTPTASPTGTLPTSTATRTATAPTMTASATTTIPASTTPTATGTATVTGTVVASPTATTTPQQNRFYLPGILK